MSTINNIILTIRLEKANRQADFDLPLDESLNNIMKFVYPALLGIDEVSEETLEKVSFYLDEKQLDKDSTLRKNAIWDGNILKIKKFNEV
ncbi:MAG: hypothetical protein PHX70_00780 [Clostridium sp.]|nr:hypothetical protein [Clostridium sp.]